MGKNSKHKAKKMENTTVETAVEATPETRPVETEVVAISAPSEVIPATAQENEVVAQTAEVVPAVATDPMAEIEKLRAQIVALQAKQPSKRVASGSKPRPNVTYTLLTKPPKWADRPQVAQLQQIIFDPAFVAAHTKDDGSVQVQEPELFAQVTAGAAAGVLRTKQEPVRIFQYYRTHLLNANCLRWQ